jgi:hypothetical protein
MKSSTNLTVLAATALIALGGQAAAQDLMIQQGRDPATGATVRVYRTTSGARLDVETKGVSIRKQLAGDKVVTTLSSRGESLVIEADRRSVSVAGARGRVSAVGDDREAFQRAKRLVSESPLAAKAAALIGKMGFGDQSPIQPLLLTTRAFLLAASDDESGARELSEWMRRARARVHVIRTGGGQKTPTDCWKGYGDEVLAAYDEFAQCLHDAKWWDPFAEARCTTIYEVRIIGAFTWYTGCVSLGSIMR